MYSRFPCLQNVGAGSYLPNVLLMTNVGVRDNARSYIDGLGMGWGLRKSCDVFRVSAARHWRMQNLGREKQMQAAAASAREVVRNGMLEKVHFFGRTSIKVGTRLFLDKDNVPKNPRLGSSIDLSPES